MPSKLLIRKFTPKASLALERYCSTHHISFNTDACLRILEEYWDLKARCQHLEHRLKDTEAMLRQFDEAANIIEKGEGMRASTFQKMDEYFSSKHIASPSYQQPASGLLINTILNSYGDDDEEE